MSAQRTMPDCRPAPLDCRLTALVLTEPLRFPRRGQPGYCRVVICRQGVNEVGARAARPSGGAHQPDACSTSRERTKVMP